MASNQPNHQLEQTGADLGDSLTRFRFLTPFGIRAPIAHLDCSPMSVIFIALGLLLGLVSIGCGSRDDQFVDVRDPAFLSKLQIDNQDWLRIQQLASERKNFTILDAARVAPNTIEVRLRNLGDTTGKQGGPMARFDKQSGSWTTQSNFVGDWWAASATRQ